MSVYHAHTLDSLTPIPILSFSSYLYAATSDMKYSAAAAQSIQFVLNHMSNGTMVFDNFDMATCTVGKSTFTCNGGLFLEALSEYMRATGDMSHMSLYA
jgi:hypothetical protein